MDVIWSEDDRFIWDEDKNESNYEDHGIWFEDATKLFFKPCAYFDSTKTVHGERRMIAIGYTNDVLIVAAFTQREQIRLISARRATSKEHTRFRKTQKRRQFFET